MWIGILVLITFGACAVACLVISIRGAMAKQWHVFIALLIPAVVIGGTIINMVYKPLTYEMFGNPHLQEIPASASKLSNDAIIADFGDSAFFGEAFLEDPEIFVLYDDNYTSEGGFKGQNADGTTWSGGWEAVDDQLCTTLGQDTTCYDVYRDGDWFYDANHRDEVVNRYRIMPARMESPDGAVALSEATVGVVVPGHTLSGELQLYMENPYFSASFAADGDTVTVTRGAAMGSSDAEETGTYRIEEEGKLCLAGVLHLNDECFTLVPSPRGFDLVREKGRILAIVTTLE